MRKIKAVVEISVPDKSELSEHDFAKRLRRSGLSNIRLAPGEVRPVTFKEFGRVVQYGPDGVRVEPKKPVTFEGLVLRALAALLGVALKDKGGEWLDTWSAEAEDYLQ